MIAIISNFLAKIHRNVQFYSLKKILAITANGNLNLIKELNL